MKHTPIPWHVGAGNGAGDVFSEIGRMRLEKAGTTLYPICNVINFDGEVLENAELIVLAVNNHEKLLLALERAELCVGKMIADDGHLKMGAPQFATGTLQMIEDLLKELDPERIIRKGEF